MGTPKTPQPVTLIAGLLAASDALLAEAADALSRRFGPIDAASAPITWDASTYYRDEMGDALRRQFVSFERLLAPGKLAAVKQNTNAMENAWRTATGRQVNIDPGYVTATKLVLASTKDAAHRVYLSGSIYAEVTLQFSNGSFRAHAQTYRDYATPEAIAFFNRVRARYLAQLRGCTVRASSGGER
jgi:hypothetical protein